ncbi:sigma 54-interacting transcriptional regulator [Aquimarina sp. U1-2]|uniref:sigma 54-interacting transcriptional regulator n=1 Tax=Aquimarina sp. U1-2 TaxID=2823141 RepID=UPI001AECDE3F|nr:sigma 54-interacting transcriptional regulator [Aquimarina sp. U1-2]MBP2831032.1 sigma 54-interacting transcriptional regulator [Aquimarina sp. U1-2]
MSSDKEFVSEEAAPFGYNHLYQVAKAFSGTSTRQELLKAILEQIKPVFGYHSARLFVVYEKEDYHIDLTAQDPEIEPSDVNYQHQQKGNAKMKHKGSSVAYCMKEVEEAGDVLLLDYKELHQRFPDYPQFVYTKETGYRDCLTGLLVFQGKTLGMFCLNALEKDFFPKEKFEFFSLICDQLAIAVNNILDKENIESEKTLNATLLRITELLVTIKNGRDLLRIIVDEVKPLFSFYDIGLFIFNKEKTHLEDWATKYEEFHLEEANLMMHYDNAVNVPLPIHEGSNMAWELDLLKKANGPAIIDIKDMAMRFPEYEQSKAILKIGHRDSLQTLLTYGGETLGFFCVNVLEKNFYTQDYFPLFQGVADQIAVAVSNLLANEEIQRREQEKTKLLALSEPIAKVRHRKELLTIIYERIHEIFPFDDAGLFTLDETGENHIDWVVDDGITKASTEILKKGISGYLPHKGSVIEAMMQDTPTLLSFEDINQQHPGHEQYEEMKAQGTKQFICRALFRATSADRKESEKIGMLCFNSKQEGFYTEKDFTLFDSIANQINLAVLNILANENLLLEKQFTEQLLEISESVAGIQDRRQLLQTFFIKVKAIIPYDEYGLFVLDETGKYHYELVNTEIIGEATVQSEVEAEFGAHARFLHKNSAIAQIMENEPAVYHLDDLADHPQKKIVKQAGLQQLLGGPLWDGDSAFGMLCFNSYSDIRYHQRHLNLFKPIAEQMATAVLKILANEQVLEEKQFKETLLGISEAVADSQSRKELFSKVLTRVKDVISFDNHGIFVFSEDGKYHQELTEDAIEAPIEVELQNSVGYGPFEHPGSPTEYFAINGPLIVDFKELTQKIPGYPQYEAMRNAGIKEILAGPLQARGKTYGVLIFSSFSKNFYTQEDIVKFRAISDLMSVAVNNVLANEQVLKEKRLTEQLLEVTASIAQIQDTNSLFKVVSDTVQPLFGFVYLNIVLLKEDNFSVVYYDPDVIGPLNTKFFENTIPLSGSPFEEYFDKHPNILLASADEWVKKFPDYEGLHLLKKNDYSHTLLNKLYHKGTLLGCLEMVYADEPSLTKEQVNLLENFSQQVALALANIISNENVLEEKQFKETLLTISEGIASIRSKQELLRYIIQKLKPIFHFYDTGIIILDEKKEKYTDWSAYYEVGESAINPLVFDHYEDGTLWNPLKGSGVAWSIKKTSKEKQPIVFDWTKDWSHLSDAKTMGFLKKSDYDRSLVYPFKLGNEVLGTFWINYRKEDDVNKVSKPLFQSVCDQLAVAISNILATEHLKEREEEKSLLVDLAKEFATIRSRNQLFKVVFDKIKNVIPFDDAGIGLFSNSLENYKEFLDFNSLESDVYSLQHTMEYDNDMLPTGAQMKKVLSSKDVIIFNRDEIIKDSDTFYAEAFEQLGYYSIIAKAFTTTNGTQLVWSLNSKKPNTYGDKDISLFAAITHQVSAAISNILAIEEIERRELEKSQQVAVISIFGQKKSWQERIRDFLDFVQEHLPFTFAAFSIRKGKQMHIYQAVERIGKEEYRSWTPKDFARASNQDEKVIASAIDKVEHYFFEKKYKDPWTNTKEGQVLYKATQDVIRAPAVANLAIPLAGGMNFLLCLYHKPEYFYDTRATPFFETIRYALAESLEKAIITDEVNALNLRLQEEKAYLLDEVEQTYGFDEIVGDSETMQEVFTKIREVADLNATVLVLGETGTGKELIARAIHNNSPRKERVLVKVNCAAIPSQIVESELFGHEKGAFTGAMKQRIGKFELADKGTIFLDEIGDMPLELQAKLLRVLQEREVERVGSNQTLKLDFRVIAATNKNLEALVRKGEFRADLFYRLNTFPIELPPVRHRSNDAVLLAEHFGRQLSHSLGLPFKGYTEKSMERIRKYPWPGNVRELQNVLEQAMILQKGRVLEIFPQKTSYDTIPGASTPSIPVPEIYDMEYIKERKEDLERKYILHILEKTKWRVSGPNGAAKLLGVANTTLESRLKRLGIEKR